MPTHRALERPVVTLPSRCTIFNASHWQGASIEYLPPSTPQPLQLVQVLRKTRSCLFQCHGDRGDVFTLWMRYFNVLVDVPFPIGAVAAARALEPLPLLLSGRWQKGGGHRAT